MDAADEGAVMNPDVDATGVDVVYRGHPAIDTGDGGRLVTVERGDKQIGLLPHVFRYSPGGFAWGYDGSGPAELARCLFIDALGPDAACKTCARQVGCPHCDEGIIFGQARQAVQVRRHREPARGQGMGTDPPADPHLGRGLEN